MSKDVDRDVTESLTRANRAYQLLGLATQVFQANAQRGDFEAAEEERDKMHAHLDEYLDQYMVANKRVLAG